MTDHPDLADLTATAQHAYEIYRTEVVNTFPNGIVDPECLTGDARRLYIDLIAAESALQEFRQQIHASIPQPREETSLPQHARQPR